MGATVRTITKYLSNMESQYKPTYQLHSNWRHMLTVALDTAQLPWQLITKNSLPSISVKCLVQGTVSLSVLCVLTLRTPLLQREEFSTVLHVGFILMYNIKYSNKTLK